MPILAPDGRYQFGSTSRIDPGFGSHNQRTYVPDIRGCFVVEHTMSISFVVGTTMAADSTYKTELAEKYHYVLKRESQSARGDTTPSGHDQGINAIICEKH